jgi:hypothetical protein
LDKKEVTKLLFDKAKAIRLSDRATFIPSDHLSCYPYFTKKKVMELLFRKTKISNKESGFVALFDTLHCII